MNASWFFGVCGASTTRVIWSISVAFVSCGIFSRPCCADSYEQAVRNAAILAASAMGAGDVSDKIVAHYLGLPDAAGDSEARFATILRNSLAEHDKMVAARGKFAMAAELAVEDPSDRASPLRLTAYVRDQFGSRVSEPASWMIDDGRDIAELLAVPVDFIGKSTGGERRDALKKVIDEPLRITRSRDDLLLYNGESALFGVSVTAGSQPRKFDKSTDGAWVTLPFGSEYVITLHNHSDSEVAVDLKIDGVNVFVLCGERHPDGRPFKYWVIPPKNSDSVRGWFLGKNRFSNFKVGEASESVAAQMGVRSTELGAVTATFSASWTDQTGPPPDEPVVERSYTVCVPAVEERQGTRKVARQVTNEAQQNYYVTMPDGRTETRTRTVQRTATVWEDQPYTYSVAVSREEKKFGTGQGEESFHMVDNVQRTIGVPRAVIAFRYDKQ